MSNIYHQAKFLLSCTSLKGCKDPTMSAMAALAAGKEQAIADWLAKQ
jgi:hypothetical protein